MRTHVARLLAVGFRVRSYHAADCDGTAFDKENMRGVDVELPDEVFSSAPSKNSRDKEANRREGTTTQRKNNGVGEDDKGKRSIIK